MDILRALGWGQSLEEIPEGIWTVCEGEFVQTSQSARHRFPAEVVRAVLGRDFSDGRILLACRDALRLVIDHYAGEGGIQTRRTVQHWHSLGL